MSHEETISATESAVRTASKGASAAWRKLARGDLSRFTFWPAQIFWYFVVGVWPLLYWLVYL